MKKQNEQNPSIEMRPFYVKDITWLKEAVKQVFPGRTVSEWRSIMGKKRNKGEELYFLGCGGQSLGGVNVTAPFNSPTWRIARAHTIASLSRPDKEEIIRQIIGGDELIYRVDLAHMELTEADFGVFGRLTGIDWPAKWETFFAPQVARWQIAFIPWEFGYLAAVTTNDREKITAIEFVREGGATLSMRVKQAAYYHGFLGHDGKILVPEVMELPDECDVLKLVRNELRLYLSGGYELKIPFAFPEGTDFQKQVWEETMKIPYGAVKTYADIAEAIQPDKSKTGQMARAVGRALAANPLPIIIPCHRVIGSNQTLTGFGGGVDVKDHLLQLEMWHAIPASS